LNDAIEIARRSRTEILNTSFSTYAVANPAIRGELKRRKTELNVTEDMINIELVRPAWRNRNNLNHRMALSTACYRGDRGGRGLS